jgi:hypothetical protein
MEQKYDKVNWIRPFVAASGNRFTVSDRSGLVKIEVGAGRRDPVLYRDEILTIIGMAVELAQYLEDHDDVIMSKEANRERSQAKRTQEQTLRKATEVLEAIPADVLERLLAARLEAKKQA